MTKLIRYIGLLFTLVLLVHGTTLSKTSSNVFSADTTQQVDMQQVLINWSLFFEDYRNGYYERAIPYGWKVMELHPTRFTALYRTLAECYRQLYLQAPVEKREVYADTMIIVWQKGIKYLPDRAPDHYLQKAFIYDNYYTPARTLDAIEAYEKAVDLAFDTIEFQYIDRLGSLYMDNMGPTNDFQERAIQLYRRYQTERDPDNPTVLERLRRLIRDPQELVELAKERLRTDPDNPANIWGVAQAYITIGNWSKAIPFLEQLTKLSPDSETYWKELARGYEQLSNFREAIRTYGQILRINPNDKEVVLRISRMYRLLGNYQQARTFAQRASRMDSSWGEPLIEIATIYEEVVEQCVVTVKGGWANMKLEDRIVYKLAQEYYERAAQIDPRVGSTARQRINFLANLIPQDEDYFFNRELIRDGKIRVFGECYEWIGESITVPPQFR